MLTDCGPRLSARHDEPGAPYVPPETLSKGTVSRRDSQVSERHPNSPDENGVPVQGCLKQLASFSFWGPPSPPLGKPQSPTGSAPHQPHLAGLLGKQQHINTDSSCHQASRSPGGPSKQAQCACRSCCQLPTSPRRWPSAPRLPQP